MNAPTTRPGGSRPGRRHGLTSAVGLALPLEASLYSVVAPLLAHYRDELAIGRSAAGVLTAMYTAAGRVASAWRATWSRWTLRDRAGSAARNGGPCAHATGGVLRDRARRLGDGSPYAPNLLPGLMMGALATVPLLRVVV